MSISRDDVKKLCRFWELPIYPDVTNQEIAFSRNRIRKQVLPALRLALNPRMDNALSQSAEILLAERLHGDLLASKLPRASQLVAWLNGYRPATSGNGPRKQPCCATTRKIGDRAEALYHGLPLALKACPFHGTPKRSTKLSPLWHCLQCTDPASVRSVRPSLVRPCEACGSRLTRLRFPNRFPKMGEVERRKKACHKRKSCGRLLLQCSRCLFLPQIGGLFVHSIPSSARSFS